MVQATKEIARLSQDMVQTSRNDVGNHFSQLTNFFFLLSSIGCQVGFGQCQSFGPTGRFHYTLVHAIGDGYQRGRGKRRNCYANSNKINLHRSGQSRRCSIGCPRRCLYSTRSFWCRPPCRREGKENFGYQIRLSNLIKFHNAISGITSFGRFASQLPRNLSVY